jgi:hypothetical protein
MRLKSHAVVTVHILAVSPGDISMLFVGYFIHCQNFAFSEPLSTRTNVQNINEILFL